MTTLPYADCQELALALLGIPDSNTQEVARIKAFINGRARKAYAASRYWPRFLVIGEERVVSDEGLLPYAETGKETIKQVLRIHASEPFKDRDAFEYANYTAKSDGILITGYQASDYTGFANMIVTETIVPESDGEYVYIGQSSPGADGTTTAPTYQRADNTNFRITPVLWFTLGGAFTGYQWQVGFLSSGNYWESDVGDYPTPDLANGNYTGIGAAAGGDMTVTAEPTYSAWVTYKAAFSETYGDDEDEESDIPEEWWEYCAWGARADFLRNDGQDEKAAAFAEREAQEKLDDQLAILDQQSGSHVFTRVINHGNMQSR